MGLEMNNNLSQVQGCFDLSNYIEVVRVDCSSISSNRVNPKQTPVLLNKFRKLRKGLLPILPTMIESLPLNEYDLIISTSSCVAKGVIPAPHARHICYVHSPMRYIWDRRDEFWPSSGL